MSSVFEVTMKAHEAITGEADKRRIRGLEAEVARLRECVKARDKATADGDTCPMCGSPRTLVGPDSWSCNGCYPTCPKELYPIDPEVKP